MNPKKIKVETTINAKPIKVWEYWTKPEHITKWNFANDDWHCPKSENDLRVGGKMKSRMEAKDGSFGFDFEAVYDEIIDQKKITYTMLDGRVAIINFDDSGDKTELTTTFDVENQNPVEMQQTVGRQLWIILKSMSNQIDSNQEIIK